MRVVPTGGQIGARTTSVLNPFQPCRKVSPITLIRQYRFATPNLLKTRSRESLRNRSFPQAVRVWRCPVVVRLVIRNFLAAKLTSSSL